jgi:hypothetical protein
VTPEFVTMEQKCISRAKKDGRVAEIGWSAAAARFQQGKHGCCDRQGSWLGCAGNWAGGRALQNARCKMRQVLQNAAR